ncbi:MAG: two-component system histidine kinase [Amycolatopsis sp.]|jgi:signal transduction histidine kinase|uniref:sensor histidine kinase n=1 Tax=Amycolatopsis sp. TaxID=37632 RepID=UPI00261C1459|nr:histidine kinase [Amycolatopsis sp.]MCU1687215.1 two-component system histidine kinase [Amycolatopsis sp.]
MDRDALLAKVTVLWRRFGPPGVILLAALLCDVGIVLGAAFDSVGPKGIDLLLLPGIASMAACAVWARTRPAVAAFAGAGSLIFFSILIRYFDVPAYSTMLANTTFTEVVGGCELVYYAVRRVRPGVAFAAVCSLVVGALVAVGGRSYHAQPGSSSFGQSLIYGVLMLFAAVLIGLYGRRPDTEQKTNGLLELVRDQWLLIGGLAFMLFLELASGLNDGLRGVPIIFCSIAAAGLAVLAGRYPVRASLGIAAVMAFGGLVAAVLGTRNFPQVAPTQVLAGMAAVTYLIRSAVPARAWACIGVMSAVVAVDTVVGSYRQSYSGGLAEIKQSFIGAVLLLGISVALGLFLRSRESERKTVVKSAVTDAQTSERMALARELHDVVAHHVTGIVVQAQAAQMMGGKDPQIALDALARIETAGGEALTAMRRLVRSMRGDAPAGSSEFSEQATTDLAADLRRLVDGVNNGVPTTLELNLPDDLPQEVGRSALRLVQESLTNIGKHAAGVRMATVLAEVTGNELHLLVTDDGQEERRTATDAGARREGGYGLIGMRERVELLHGRLFAGRGYDGGWRVEAWLPVEGDE